MWLLTLKGKGYAVVAVMEFLDYGKRPSIFDVVLYLLFICSLIVEGMLVEAFDKKLSQALKINQILLYQFLLP